MKKINGPFSLLPWFMALLFSSFLAACGGGGQEPTAPASTVVSIAVTPGTASIPTNGVQAFVAIATFGDGSTRDVSATSNWTTAATGVATVVQTSGVVTGVSSGSSAITASFGGKSNASTVTVTTATLLSISVSPGSTTVPVNGVQPFMASATYSDGSVRDVTPYVSWSSGTTSVGTVVQTTGVVTGLASGSSLVTASFGGKTNTAALTVTSASLVSVTVIPAVSTLRAGLTQTLAAKATYSDGTVVDITSAAAWTSSAPLIATVTANTGLVTAIASGDAVVTAAWGSKSGSGTVTVSVVTLTSIAVSPASTTVQPGDSKIFTATGSYSDGSTADLTATVVWTSSMPQVATVVSNSGLASALSNGSTLITASANGKSGSITLTVSTAMGRAGVGLGSSGNFVALAKSGISTTGTTAIVGDIGVSPAAASFITGFGLIADATNTFARSSLVTGKVYASNYAAPTPAYMTTAIGDMQTAFTDAAGRTLPDFTELGAGNVSGLSLIPGLYKWGTGVLVTGAGVTLTGGANDVWIFQIAQDLTISNSANIILSGGAQAKNVFWQVSGKATLGTAANFSGVLMSQTLISVGTGAVVNGRLLAQTAITLDAARVTAP